VRQYDTLYVEAIHPTNLCRRPAATRIFKTPDGTDSFTMLAVKPAYAGKRVEVVPPAYTTQECSNVLADGTICGVRSANSLAVRTHSCSTSGSVADRDANAARNIPWRGQRLRGLVA
jgi:putative transposase